MIFIACLCAGLCFILGVKFGVWLFKHSLLSTVESGEYIKFDDDTTYRLTTTEAEDVDIETREDGVQEFGPGVFADRVLVLDKRALTPMGLSVWNSEQNVHEFGYDSFRKDLLRSGLFYNAKLVVMADDKKFVIVKNRYNGIRGTVRS